MNAVAQWPVDPEAAVIIASCIERRPDYRRHVEQYGCTLDISYMFTGKRVRRLKAIQRRYLEAALKVGDASGNHDQAKAELISVDEVIENAIAAAPIGRFARQPLVVIAEQGRADASRQPATHERSLASRLRRAGGYQAQGAAR
jgi:hypothetical protein